MASFTISLAGYPEDVAEVLRSGIAGCEVATKLKARGAVGGKDRGGRFCLTEE